MNSKTKNILFGVLILVLVALIVFLLISFRTGQAVKQETIKVGAILPLTGSGASMGQAVMNSLIMAQEEINSKGGINGKNILVIFEDSALDPKIGISVAQKLISVDKVNSIFVFGTAICEAVQPITEKEKVILLAFSTDPALPQKGKYTFRIMYNLYQSTSYFKEYLESSNSQNVAVLYQNVDVVSRQLSYLKQNLENTNIKLIDEESFEQGQIDFRTQLTKIKEKNPDVLIIIGFAFHYPTIFKTLSEFGMLDKTKILGGLDFLTPPASMNIDLLEGVVFVTPRPTVIVDSQKTKDFVEEYKSQYNADPNYFSIYSYDNLIILSEAIKRKGDSSDEIKKGLLGIREYGGVSGKINIDQEGNAETSVVLATYKKGKIILFSSS